MSSSSKEAILAAARRAAQAHGYNGLNFRDLADEVGIKAASIYYHFPSKADLGAAVARRYWEDTASGLETMLAETSDPVRCLRRYPEVFRKALDFTDFPLDEISLYCVKGTIMLPTDAGDLVT